MTLSPSFLPTTLATPVNKILQNNNKKILSYSHDLQTLLHRRFVLVQKQCMNLKQILVQTDINPKQIPKGTGPCNGPCVICTFMQTPTEFTSRVTKTRFPINGRFNCKTKSAVYLINCKKCDIQYMGQTGNTINERIRGHITDIRPGYDTKPVSRHFTTNQHTLNDVSVMVICTTSQNVNIRFRTEEVWICLMHMRTWRTQSHSVNNGKTTNHMWHLPQETEKCAQPGTTQKLSAWTRNNQVPLHYLWTSLLPYGLLRRHSVSIHGIEKRFEKVLSKWRLQVPLVTEPPKPWTPSPEGCIRARIAPHTTDRPTR